MVKRVLGILAIVILIAIIGYGILAVSASSSCSCDKADKVPEVGYPCYLVTTTPPSLVYVAESVTETDTRVVLNRPYYVKIGGEWKYRDGDNALMRAAYREINVKLLSAP